MFKVFQMVTIVATCLFAFVGCATTSTEATPVAVAEKPACETCAKGKSGESVWCDHCGAGYAEGKKMACQGCWKAKADGTECTSCAKQAKAPEGEAPATEATTEAASAPEAKAEEAAPETKAN